MERGAAVAHDASLSPTAQGVRAAALLVSGLNCLTWAHDLGIIHRDIKLENFTECVVGEERVIQLTDFSACKVQLWAKQQASKCVGQCSSYRAPEIAMHQQYGTKVDVFSLGVCVAVLYSGQWPVSSALQQSFESHPTRHNLNRLEKSYVDNVQALMHGTDPVVSALRTVLLRMLQFDPDARVSAAELLASDELAQLSTVCGVSLLGGAPAIEANTLRGSTAGWPPPGLDGVVGLGRFDWDGDGKLEPAEQVLIQKAVHKAVRNQDEHVPVIVAEYLGLDIAVALPDHDGRCLLDLICQFGHQPCAPSMLRAALARVDPSELPTQGRLLNIALDAHNPNSLDFAEALLAKKVSLSASVDRRGRTALFLAAVRGDLDVLDLLLGRDDTAKGVDHKDHEGTPLVIAAVKERPHGNTVTVVRRLVKAGADLASTDREGRTARQRASNKRVQRLVDPDYEF
eukprot:TRINITY_DN6934_c0_g1_i6.p1 TRINITY_DN6934_c0_g1~~TRINITY_DN6934_c0_g1_i6.p1  ORF type:complete len:457 (-),score=90.68 TRINITY_DN6934_c0_g1_i6:3-1373(-)